MFIKQKVVKDVVIVDVTDFAKVSDAVKDGTPCAWCYAPDDDWYVMDTDFIAPVHRSFVKFCFHCGRRLRD